MSRPSPRPLSHALLGALFASSLLSACGGLGTYATPCFDDSGCENGAVCRAGECVLQCVTPNECPASAPLCQFNRCIAPPGGDDAAQADALPLSDLGSFPDAAALTPDAAALTPDAAALTPDVAALTPDATAVTPDAAALTPDAAALTPDAAALTPDATP